MNIRDIQILYEYNRWANAKTRTAASQLTTEQFVQNLSSSFPSVRDTLVHILAAEWIWLERWRGVSPPALLRAQEFPTLDVVVARWSDMEREQSEFIHQLTD